MLGNEESFVIVDQIAPIGQKAKIPAHPVGTVLPLTGAAMGRALLSCLDEEDAIAITRSLSASVKPGHDKAWRTKLREIRLRGYDTSLEEFQRGVNAVAVAIQRAGEAYLAVALIGYVHDFPARRIDEMGRKLAADVPVATKELVSTFGHGSHSCPAARFSITRRRDWRLLR